MMTAEHSLRHLPLYCIYVQNMCVCAIADQPLIQCPIEEMAAGIGPFAAGVLN